MRNGKSQTKRAREEEKIEVSLRADEIIFSEPSEKGAREEARRLKKCNR